MNDGRFKSKDFGVNCEGVNTVAEALSATLGIEFEERENNDFGYHRFYSVNRHECIRIRRNRDFEDYGERAEYPGYTVLVEVSGFHTELAEEKLMQAFPDCALLRSVLAMEH
jgi:hypothetical protein